MDGSGDCAHVNAGVLPAKTELESPCKAPAAQATQGSGDGHKDSDARIASEVVNQRSPISVGVAGELETIVITPIKKQLAPIAHLLQLNQVEDTKPEEVSVDKNGLVASLESHSNLNSFQPSGEDRQPLCNQLTSESSGINDQLPSLHENLLENVQLEDDQGSTLVAPRVSESITEHVIAHRPSDGSCAPQKTSLCYGDTEEYMDGATILNRALSSAQLPVVSEAFPWSAVTNSGGIQLDSVLSGDLKGVIMSEDYADDQPPAKLRKRDYETSDGTRNSIAIINANDNLIDGYAAEMNSHHPYIYQTPDGLYYLEASPDLKSESKRSSDKGENVILTSGPFSITPVTSGSSVFHVESANRHVGGKQQASHCVSQNSLSYGELEITPVESNKASAKVYALPAFSDTVTFSSSATLVDSNKRGYDPGTPTQKDAMASAAHFDLRPISHYEIHPSNSNAEMRLKSDTVKALPSASSFKRPVQIIISDAVDNNGSIEMSKLVHTFEISPECKPPVGCASGLKGDVPQSDVSDVQRTPRAIQTVAAHKSVVVANMSSVGDCHLSARDFTGMDIPSEDDSDELDYITPDKYCSGNTSPRGFVTQPRVNGINLVGKVTEAQSLGSYSFRDSGDHLGPSLQSNDRLLYEQAYRSDGISQHIATTDSSHGGRILSTWKLPVSNNCRQLPAAQDLHSPWTSEGLVLTPQSGRLVHQTNENNPTSLMQSNQGMALQQASSIHQSCSSYADALLQYTQQKPIYQTTPLATIANKQSAQQATYSGYRTPSASLSSITLNSSGSEGHSTPPDYLSKPGQSVSTPYNTPADTTGSSIPNIPTACQLNAALLHAKGSLSESEFDLGRQAHNAKERARRARIKIACEHLRDLVPGMTIKTDKATVFEFAVQYIAYLKKCMNGNTYDREFLRKCSPY